MKMIQNTLKLCLLVLLTALHAQAEGEGEPEPNSSFLTRAEAFDLTPNGFFRGEWGFEAALIERGKHSEFHQFLHGEPFSLTFRAEEGTPLEADFLKRVKGNFGDQWRLDYDAILAGELGRMEAWIVEGDKHSVFAFFSNGGDLVSIELRDNVHAALADKTLQERERE